MPSSPQEADLIVGPSGEITEQEPKAPQKKVEPTIGKAKVKRKEPEKVKPMFSSQPGKHSTVSSVTYY